MRLPSVSYAPPWQGQLKPAGWTGVTVNSPPSTSLSTVSLRSSSRGPPVRALDRYTFEISGGNLKLLLPYSVGEVEGEGANAKIIAYQQQGPGEHVDGLSAFLYPIQPKDLEY